MELDITLLRAIEKEQGGAYYILDTAQFAANFNELQAAFREYYPDTCIAYSYKTNYTPRLCQIVEQLGGYAEVVSDMEYEITRRLGIPTSKVHFNGPYKAPEAMKAIILGGGTVNLDDYAEVPLVCELAEAHPDSTIRIGLRCNFKINDGVTSRFGFDTTKPEFHQLIQSVVGREWRVEQHIGHIRRAQHIQTPSHIHLFQRALQAGKEVDVRLAEGDGFVFLFCVDEQQVTGTHL
jgi:diaminopimelate decarboxylase